MTKEEVIHSSVSQENWAAIDFPINKSIISPDWWHKITTTTIVHWDSIRANLCAFRLTISNNGRSPRFMLDTHLSLKNKHHPAKEVGTKQRWFHINGEKKRMKHRAEQVAPVYTLKRKCKLNVLWRIYLAPKADSRDNDKALTQ